MKIGVLSDIHDNIGNLLKSFKVFKKEGVKKVFFCGDLCSPFTVDYFKKLKIPVLAIFGNNEGDKISIQERIERNKLDFKYAPKQGVMWDLKLSGKKIGMYHGTNKQIVEGLVSSGNFDILLSGHTHVAGVKRSNETLWINPGSVCGWAGLLHDPVKASVAILNLNTSQTKIINL